MDVKATANLVANDLDGSFAGPLKNTAGSKVNVKAGDWITSDMSSEIDWIVPNISVVADSSTGHVTGECGTESSVRVTVYRNGEAFSDDWDLPEGGSFDFDSADGHVIFQAGDQVLIQCEIAAGDWVERMTTAI
jgi:hypothetical protein